MEAWDRAGGAGGAGGADCSDCALLPLLLEQPVLMLLVLLVCGTWPAPWVVVAARAVRAVGTMAAVTRARHPVAYLIGRGHTRAQYNDGMHTSWIVEGVSTNAYASDTASHTPHIYTAVHTMGSYYRRGAHRRVRETSLCLFRVEAVMDQAQTSQRAPTSSERGKPKSSL